MGHRLRLAEEEQEQAGTRQRLKGQSECDVRGFDLVKPSGAANTDGG